MSNEAAFSNSEQLFRQAYAAADPATPLLQLLKQHPTYPTVRDLTISYTEAVEENPSRGQTLASALARVAKSPDAPTFGTDTLTSLIDRELADQHFKVDYGNSRITEYGPKNTYLLESLLSGLSFKHKLTSTSDMFASILAGLDARAGSENPQVLLVGTCIQLLLHGSVVVTEAGGSYRKSAEDISKKLKAEKEAGIVKDPHAIQVLELAISHAEAGFKPENDREDVWALLFPSKP